MIPSKELLSEVLNDKKILLSKNDLLIGDNVLLFDNQCNYLVNINIYELAHKCKEWASEQGYIIEVGVHPTIKRDKTDRDYFYKITTDRGQILVSKLVEIIKTEPKAIFKACEWIMEQTK